MIPWAGGCSWREAALDDVRRWWSQLPYPVVLGHGDGESWSKADAVADGLDYLGGDVGTLVIADADVFLARAAAVIHAVGMVTSGRYRWAVPHGQVKRLTQTGTVRWRSDRGEPRRPWDRGGAYRGQAAGGVVVVDGELYRQAPLDAGFVGWGHEDVAAEVAWRSLAGPPWRGDVDLFHLWHPPARKISEAVGSAASKQLLNRYRTAAKAGPAAVAELVAARAGARM